MKEQILGASMLALAAGCGNSDVQIDPLPDTYEGVVECFAKNGDKNLELQPEKVDPIIKCATDNYQKLIETLGIIKPPNRVIKHASGFYGVEQIKASWCYNPKVDINPCEIAMALVRAKVLSPELAANSKFLFPPEYRGAKKGLIKGSQFYALHRANQSECTTSNDSSQIGVFDTEFEVDTPYWDDNLPPTGTIYRVENLILNPLHGAWGIDAQKQSCLDGEPDYWYNLLRDNP